MPSVEVLNLSNIILAPSGAEIRFNGFLLPYREPLVVLFLDNLGSGKPESVSSVV